MPFLGAAMRRSAASIAGDREGMSRPHALGYVSSWGTRASAGGRAVGCGDRRRPLRNWMGLSSEA